MNNRKIYLNLLRKLKSNQAFTQRELSQEMGVSLGKVNYCMKALTKKGWVKLMSFSHNPNKIGYAYLLTSKRVEEKANLTFKFIRIKMAEYQMLENEVNELKRDIVNLKLSNK